MFAFNNFISKFVSMYPEEGMGKIISVVNQKGGVGKTTLTFNLAWGLADRNYNVLALDNDPQGNLTSAFGESPEKLDRTILNIYQDSNIEPYEINPRLHFIPANIHLAKIADSDFEIIFKLKEALLKYLSYDLIIIDCLPSFGYLNMAALNASDLVLIPTNPSPFALSGLVDLMQTINKTKTRLNNDLQVLGILINLVEGRTTTLGNELEQALRNDYGDIIFDTVINKSIKIEESPVFHKSIMDYAPNSKSAKQYENFINEFVKRLKNEQKS
jgi:chromosome partitioning protein